MQSFAQTGYLLYLRRTMHELHRYFHQSIQAKSDHQWMIPDT